MYDKNISWKSFDRAALPAQAVEYTNCTSEDE